MKAFKLIALLAIIATLAGTTSCDSHSSKISKIKKTLLWGNKGKEGVWRMEYSYDFIDGYVLTAVETLTLRKDGQFTEETIYCYDGDALAKATWTGVWDIEYDGKLDAYFFDQDYNEELEIQNLNMNKKWFKRFDTDLRLVRRGDAYSSLEDDDDDTTLYGLEIIDFQKNLFLVKNLDTKTVYRYEPTRLLADNDMEVSHTDKKQAAPPEEVGDAPDEASYTLYGKIDGKYPIEMEITAIEDNIVLAGYRYTQTGSGEWIDLEIEKDDMGRTRMYESLNGERTGCLEGRLSTNGNYIEFSGWHKNLKTGKELLLYADNKR